MDERGIPIEGCYRNKIQLNKNGAKMIKLRLYYPMKYAE